ncbi:MAG: DnaJ domain-containing protein [Butyrivibrio sp.]|nr:DnaJ domain-containing protein [Butyrivibrio sp.]MBR1640990.1 DnaJ domain-containing protein [Butyrivibrio sp.]
MTLKEAFKILGASKKDSEREIKSKYKKLLFLYHPDSDPGKERRQDFKERREDPLGDSACDP